MLQKGWRRVVLTSPDWHDACTDQNDVGLVCRSNGCHIFFSPLSDVRLDHLLSRFSFATPQPLLPGSRRPQYSAVAAVANHAALVNTPGCCKKPRLFPGCLPRSKS